MLDSIQHIQQFQHFRKKLILMKFSKSNQMMIFYNFGPQNIVNSIGYGDIFPLGAKGYDFEGIPWLLQKIGVRGGALAARERVLYPLWFARARPCTPSGEEDPGPLFSLTRWHAADQTPKSAPEWKRTKMVSMVEFHKIWWHLALFAHSGKVVPKTTNIPWDQVKVLRRGAISPNFNEI